MLFKDNIVDRVTFENNRKSRTSNASPTLMALKVAMSDAVNAYTHNLFDQFAAARAYDVPRSTLHELISGHPFRATMCTMAFL
jgi:hypothetical protein